MLNILISISRQFNYDRQWILSLCLENNDALIMISFEYITPTDHLLYHIDYQLPMSSHLVSILCIQLQHSVLFFTYL